MIDCAKFFRLSPVLFSVFHETTHGSMPETIQITNNKFIGILLYGWYYLK